MSRLKAVLVICLIIAVVPHASANQVNGVAAYQALSVEQFLAVLYTRSPVIEPEALLAKDTPARMEIRVTTKRLSQRRFMTMWLESITVNNPSAAVEAHLASLTKFNKMFKGRLVDGDRIVFDYRPAIGMEVSVNGVTLGIIESGDFFRLILACWIGEVPISSNLKVNLLNPVGIDSEMLARFNAVTPALERREEIVAWTEVKAAESAPKASVQQASASNVKVETKAAAPSAAPKKITPPVDAPKPEVKPVEKVAQSKPVATPKVAEPKVVARATEVVAPPVKAAPVVKQEPKAPAPEKVSETVVELESDDETMEGLDEGGLLVRQQYYDQLAKHLIQQQSIPRQAFQRRLEDEVRVYLTVDRNGNVLSAELEGESKYKMFNQQALEAVEKAEVFPAMPEEISGETFSFSVLLNYRLPI